MVHLLFSLSSSMARNLEVPTSKSLKLDSRTQRDPILKCISDFTDFHICELWKGQKSKLTQEIKIFKRSTNKSVCPKSLFKNHSKSIIVVSAKTTITINPTLHRWWRR